MNRAPVPEFEGYEVDEAGRVFARRHGIVRERRPTVNKNGYQMLTITRQGKVTTVYVHRLVARAFVPGFAPGLWVNHKNGEKLDNRAENLEWTTPGENNAHMYRVLKVPHPMAGVRGAACNYSTPIEGYDPETGEVRATFAAMKEAHRAGYKAGAISRCVRSGRLHRGLRWRLASQTTTASTSGDLPSKTPGYTQP